MYLQRYGAAAELFASSSSGQGYGVKNN